MEITIFVANKEQLTIATEAAAKVMELQQAMRVAAMAPPPPVEEKPKKRRAADAPPVVAPPAEAEPPAVKLEQVRAVLAALSQAGKTAEVRTMLQSFGATRLTELPADKYQDVLTAAEAI
jgi:hypothetical protein